MDACWLLGPPVIYLSHTIHKWHKINYEAVVSIKKKKKENWKLRSKSKTCFDSPREREREGVWLLCVWVVLFREKRGSENWKGIGFYCDDETQEKTEERRRWWVCIRNEDEGGAKWNEKKELATLRLRLYLWWIMISPLLPSFWWVSFLPCK